MRRFFLVFFVFFSLSMKNTQRVSYVVLCSMLLFEGVLPVSSYAAPIALAADDSAAETATSTTTEADTAIQPIETTPSTEREGTGSAASEQGNESGAFVTETPTGTESADSGAVFQHTEDFENQIVSTLNTPLIDKETELPSQKQTTHFSLEDLVDLVVVEPGLGTLHFSGNESQSGSLLADLENKFAEEEIQANDTKDDMTKTEETSSEETGATTATQTTLLDTKNTNLQNEEKAQKQILDSLAVINQAEQKTLTFETNGLDIGIHEVTSAEDSKETALISVAPTPPARSRDTTAPVILATSLDTPNQATLSFSESLNTENLSAASFEILPISGESKPTITSFFYDKENQSVILGIQGLEPAISYALIPHDIFDTIGNSLSVEKNTQILSLDQVKFFKNQLSESTNEPTPTTENPTPEETQQTAHETTQDMTPNSQPREEQPSAETQTNIEPTF